MGTLFKCLQNKGLQLLTNISICPIRFGHSYPVQIFEDFLYEDTVHVKGLSEIFSLLPPLYRVFASIP